MVRGNRVVSRPDHAATLLKAWERGLSLPAALRCFDGGARWSRARADVLSGFRALTRSSASPLADRAGAIENLQGLAAAWEEQQRVLQAVQDRLIAALMAGTAFAIGFEQLSGGTQRLAPIPRSLWRSDCEIDWERSRLDGGTRLFVEIRVLVPSARGPDRISGAETTAYRQ